MKDRHSGILSQHKHRNGSPDHDRTADHRCAPPSQRPVRAALEQQHYGCGRCGYVFRPAAEREVSLIGRMGAVDVFMRRHRIGDFTDRQVWWKRLLEHDAVDGVVVVQAREALANLGSARALRQAVDLYGDADFLARALQISYVRNAGFVLTDENDDEPRMNPGVTQRIRTCEQFNAQIRGKCSSVKYQGGHAVAVSSPKERDLEVVRREIQLDPRFAPDDFERAFESFVQTYNVVPNVARCSPDVLERYCRLFERGDDAARRRELRFRGVPLYAAVLAGGTIVFEGEVDEDRMGDW
jgi:hypothetical protein